jgi:hypothetical protein
MGEVGEEVENKMQNARRLMESRLKQRKRASYINEQKVAFLG